MEQQLSPTARVAQAYINEFGLHVVPLRPNEKKPIGKHWSTFSGAEEAIKFYNENPACGIGVHVGKSRICSLDLDWPEAVEILTAEFGVLKFNDLVSTNATIKGKNLRVVFRAPEGLNLGHKSLVWKDKDGKGRTVFELRAADPEVQKQDVFPPSVHPDTKEKYTWVTKLSEFGLKEPPSWLLYIWMNWEKFKPQLEAANPNAAPVEERKPKHSPERKQYSNDHSWVELVNMFDEANDLITMLERYGYKKCGRRYMSPHSSSGIPGVEIMGNKAWVHHESDPLCSNQNGTPVGPFDLFREYEHDGDYAAATKAAAKQLGIKPNRAPLADEKVVKQVEKSVDIKKPHHMTIESIIDGLPVNKEGRIIATFTSLAAVIGTFPIAFDDFLQTAMIERKGGKLDRFQDADYVDIAIQLETIGFGRFGLPTIKEVVRKVMMGNRFDSAQVWIDGLEWDGVDRCTKLFANYFGVPSCEYSDAASKYIVTAMAGRIIEPGCKADMVPILIGGQGVGKTTAVKAMAPMLDTFSEIDLSSKRDADLARQVRGKLICELGELRGLKTKESEAIKAWVTRTHEEWVPKYTEYTTTMARRCVFIGTTNEEEFLIDQTGNRRWLPLTVQGVCDFDAVERDRDQIWAQAAVMFRENGVMWRAVAGLSEPHQTKHMVADEGFEAIIADVLESYFYARDKIPTIELADKLYEKHSIRISDRAVPRRIAEAMRLFGYKADKFRYGDNKNPIRGYSLEKQK